MIMSASKSAIDVLMNNARSKKCTPSKKRFPCPAGCGCLVTENEVNSHLDKCLGSELKDNAASASKGNSDNNVDGSSEDNTECTIGSAAKRQNKKDSPTSSTTTKSLPNNGPNAFSHMMKNSATAFSKSINSEKVVHHRFHLHNVEGYVTWTSEEENDVDETNDDEDNNTANQTDLSTNEGAHNNKDSSTDISGCKISSEDTKWSASTTITSKRMQQIIIHQGDQQQGGKDLGLELTVTSSLPCVPDGERSRLVQRHSRFSISHLKSCLQKSIRRRAPLPAVRVAMELADRAWGDLIRRLPIIVLEDSSLHPDFGLLVWLMVAESKGYFPCLPLLKRVLQIVFEMASCPRQDKLPETEDFSDSDCNNLLPPTLSLVTPSLQLFPDQKTSETNNANVVFIRSMLLRAQYGGMKCDVRMLHSFAVIWLKRSHQRHVPTSINFLDAESKSQQSTLWLEVPKLLHEKARMKSEELVTSKIVCPGGLLKLSEKDVCAAGIDFHCSSVVDHLLSQQALYASLCQRLGKSENGVGDREWVSGQVKSMIWNYSSGINHRRSFEVEKKRDDGISRAVWKEILKAPFEQFTNAFVRDRLA